MSMTHDDVTRAARAMTAVEPPADLEAKIKRRLDAEASRTQPRWRPAYWLGAAGLTATAVLLALVVQGPTQLARRSPGEGGSTVQGSLGVQGPTELAVQGSSEGPKSEPQVQEANRGPWTLSNPGPQVPRAPRVSQPIRLPAYRTLSESEAGWMSRTVPALDVIDPIQPEPVSLAPLTMTPLMTSPMVGEPHEGRQ
jgi:hypothetical protein